MGKAWVRVWPGTGLRPRSAIRVGYCEAWWIEAQDEALDSHVVVSVFKFGNNRKFLEWMKLRYLPLDAPITSGTSNWSRSSGEHIMYTETDESYSGGGALCGWLE